MILLVVVSSVKSLPPLNSFVTILFSEIPTFFSFLLSKSNKFAVKRSPSPARARMNPSGFPYSFFLPYLSYEVTNCPSL